jgi:hypothetical protein
MAISPRFSASSFFMEPFLEMIPRYHATQTGKRHAQLMEECLQGRICNRCAEGPAAFPSHSKIRGRWSGDVSPPPLSRQLIRSEPRDGLRLFRSRCSRKRGSLRLPGGSPSRVGRKRGETHSCGRRWGHHPLRHRYSHIPRIAFWMSATRTEATNLGCDGRARWSRSKYALSSRGMKRVNCE